MNLANYKTNPDMAQLTAEQLTELGFVFLSIANAVDEYRMENRPQLSDDENQTLKILHSTLTHHADDLFATSAITLLSEVEGSLQKLKEVTSSINATYRRLRKVQKAIDIAAAAITVGTAILTRDAKSLRESVAGLMETVKKEE